MTASMHLTEFSHMAVASTSMPWGQHNLGVSVNHLILFISMASVHVEINVYPCQVCVVCFPAFLFTACCEACCVNAVPAGP